MEFSLKGLQLDTKDMVQKFKEMSKMEGVSVLLCAGEEGFGGGGNVIIVLEHVSGTRFTRIGTFEYGLTSRWIKDWYGNRTRITLI